MADFRQAIEWLRERKKVRRKCWDNSQYLYCDCDMIKHRSGEIYGLFISDFEKTDWEVYRNELSIDNIIHVAVKCIRPLTEEEMKFFDKWYKKEFED